MSGRNRPQPVTPAVRGELAAWLRGVDSGAVTRRDFVVRATALGVSASSIGMLLAACGGGSDADGGSGATPVAMSTALPKQLKVYNWADYLSPKVRKQFAADRGVPVDVTIFDSNEACIAGVKAEPAAYDVLFPEEWAAETMMQAGLLHPLDMSLIPNFKYVTQPEFQKPPYDPESDGNKYTTPYMFGSIGFAVRLDKIADPPSSWEILYDAQYEGEISMIEGARDTLTPALFLGGGDQNVTDQAAIDAATQKAIEQKPLVLEYTSANMGKNIVKGVALVQCWDGDAIDSMNKLGISKIRYVLPEEGYPFWADALCVPKNAPSPYTAHLFLDMLLDPKVAAENANNTGYQPVVEAADPLIKSLVQRAMRPTPEQIAGGTYSKALGAEADAAYEAAWKKLQQA